jgi:hypothetical protein
MTVSREHAHELIDQLPEAQLSGLIGFLETIVDPVATALRNAPLDDEPVTDADRRAIAAADEWLRHNEPIPLEEVLKDFGLTMTDWETMGQTPLPEENDNGARNG